MQFASKKNSEPQLHSFSGTMKIRALVDVSTPA